MLDGGFDIISEAREEYMRTGTLTVSTYSRLTEHGYEAGILMAQWESGIDREEEVA